MHYLGRNILYLRKKVSKSQSEIALMVKKGQTTVANWEIGRSEPSLDELIAISNIFGITVDALLKVDLQKFEDEPRTPGSSFEPSKIYLDVNIMNLASEVQALRKEVDELKKHK